MPEPANSALEDARKRARRRLVGAIVLALGAAVIVPMFLESDPKPLGPDVQIQIPAIDEAKFQNRLTPQGKGPGPDKSAVPATVPARPPEPAPAEPAKPAPPPAAEPPSPKIAAAPATEAEPKPTAPAKQAEKRPAPPNKAAPAPAPEPPPTTNLGTATLNTTPPPAAKTGEFVVQIGAFVDRTVATEMAAKAGEQGFPVFLEGVTTKSGQVQRVRVGPFPSKAAADAAAAKLAAAGFTAEARPR